MIKITFTGDIMLKPQILRYYSDKKNNDFNEIFDNVREIFEKSDFVVGNLETPISDDKNDYRQEQYRFTSPIEFAQAVKNAGINLVTTANNHCLDNGIEGVKKTVNCLNKIGLDNTGIFDTKNNNRPYFVDIKGKRFAFLSYTYGTNAFNNNVYINKDDNVHVNLFQKQELSNKLTRFIYKNNFILTRAVRKIFRKLSMLQLNIPVYERREKSLLKNVSHDIQVCKSEKVDYIVMCMHCGGQYSDEPTKYTKRIVSFLYKNGVDMIIGNHEHVIHNCKIIDGELIAYCLGNFVGTAGVLDEPFDKMAEYSILVHTYFNDDDNLEFSEATFSIVKTVLNPNGGEKAIKVVPLYNLIKNCDNQEEKEKMINDYNKICKNVLRIELDKFEIEEEIEIK